MTDPRRLLDSTTGHEAFKTVPYKDSKALWTFAIGRCLETHPLTASEWKYLLDSGAISVVINLDGANWLAIEELEAREHDLSKTFSWFDHIGDVRQNAFVEMAFQMGWDRFQGFHDMLSAAALGDWSTVHDEALDSKWAKIDSPKRAKELATMLLTGQWQ